MSEVPTVFQRRIIIGAVLSAAAFALVGIRLAHVTLMRPLDLGREAANELIEEFDFLGEWEDQCEYLIELGRELPDLPAALKTDDRLVPGCQARVWFIPEVRKEAGRTVIDVRAKSDAMIVDGGSRT